MEKKICAISDIHGSLIDIPECDILCICGDILPLDIQRCKYKSIAWLAGPFQKWLLEAPCKHVVITWGNHDFIGEMLYKERYEYGFLQEEILFPMDKELKINILIDESKDVDGITFYGTPWCPSLQNWAFYGTSEELTKKFDNIPHNTQVLLTHCPPKFGKQGVVLQSNNWNYERDFGCQELRDAIEKKFAVKSTPTYILSGHIHSGNHNFEFNGGIVYKNVSIKNEDYEITYEPQIIYINI